MEVKDNLRVIKARYAAVNAHDWEKFQGFYAKSIVWSDPGLQKPIEGPRTVRRRLESLAKAFPDLRWKLGRIFGQGQNVSAEFTFTGTHKGPLADASGIKLEATNTRIRIPASGIYVVRAGKIIDSKIYFDFGRLVSQLQAHRPAKRA
jgi:steroid delta-isomerase-like uncharacterized protein